MHYADVKRDGSPACGTVRGMRGGGETTLVKTRVNCVKCIPLIPKEKAPWE